MTVHTSGYPSTPGIDKRVTNGSSQTHWPIFSPRETSLSASLIVRLTNTRIGAGRESDRTRSACRKLVTDSTAVERTFCRWRALFRATDDKRRCLLQIERSDERADRSVVQPAAWVDAYVFPVSLLSIRASLRG